MSLEWPLKSLATLIAAMHHVGPHTYVRMIFGSKMILTYFEFRTLSYIPAFDSWVHIAWCTCSKRFTMSTTSATKHESVHSSFARHVVDRNLARVRTNLRPFLPGTEPWVLRPPPVERRGWLACLTAHRPKSMSTPSGVNAGGNHQGNGGARTRHRRAQTPQVSVGACESVEPCNFQGLK